MADEYTSTDDEVRLVWSEWSNYGSPTDRPDYDADRAAMRAEFDRFLARVRRDAFREGQAAGVEDALLACEIASGIKPGPPPGPTPNPYKESP